MNGNALQILRIVVVFSGFGASAIYLMLYLFNETRQRDIISNLLLHLGVVQVLAYGNGILRMFVFPRVNLPVWIENAMLLVTNIGALSLSLWILAAYLQVNREGKRMEGITKDD